jgi:hypothetical protein
VNRIRTVLMRRRPAILGLAAVLVALLVTPSAATVKTSVEPRGGKWNGKTAQGLPIEFVVKKKPKGWKVLSVRYQVKATCTSTGPGGETLGTWTPTQTGEFPVTIVDENGIDTGVVDAGNSYGQSRNQWNWAHSGGGTTPIGTANNFSVIEGKFLDRRKATGRLKFDAEQQFGFGGYVCASGTVRWTAHR